MGSMRRVVLLLLTAILAALITARGTLPEPARTAMAAPVREMGAYNMLNLELPAPTETAGSALIAEMNRHFLSRTPTAKHEYTGILSGRNLILLLAETWRPERLDRADTPALYRLWQEGIHFADFYAPDWYQGLDGREFALLTGLTPTTVQNSSSMALLAEKPVRLPFALAAALGRAGYTCRALSAGAERAAAYEALGFAPSGGGSLSVEELAGDGPFFLYCVLEDANGEAALERLLTALERADLAAGTAICLVTGGTEPLRGCLFLWAQDLPAVTVPAPCSELDVTPTLLDLFGLDYDSRFLSGRDVLADGSRGEPTPPVALYGSAYSDWVSDEGGYAAAESAFYPSSVRHLNPAAQRAYVLAARQQVYDSYVYSRRILESDYFRQFDGP